MIEMSKSKREIIDKGILEQEEYYSKKIEEERKLRKKQDDPAKPSLLKRFASILLDALMIISIVLGLQLLSFNFVLNNLGYTDDQDYIQNSIKASHLYILNEMGDYITITSKYDDSKTPEENYDVVITYFYSTNQRAIDENKIEEYNNHKIESGNYVLDNGVIVRSNTATDTRVKECLEKEYVKAIKFLKSDPKYIYSSNHSLLLAVSSLMICSVISTLIFYLIIPLFNRNHATLGQMICGLALVNDEDNKEANKKQVIIRYIIVLLTSFLLPISIMLMSIDFAGMPIFVNAGVMCFTKNNDSFHGYFSRTKVINKSRSNPMETLKQIIDMNNVENNSQNHK